MKEKKKLTGAKERLQGEKIYLGKKWNTKRDKDFKWEKVAEGGNSGWKNKKRGSGGPE